MSVVQPLAVRGQQCAGAGVVVLVRSDDIGEEMTASRPEDPIFPLPDSRYEGMTLRQLFAAAALAGLLARPREARSGRPSDVRDDGEGLEGIAARAVIVADLTLARLGVCAKG